LMVERRPLGSIESARSFRARETGRAVVAPWSKVDGLRRFKASGTGSILGATRSVTVTARSGHEV
jgi:hypothetical protein